MPASSKRKSSKSGNPAKKSPTTGKGWKRNKGEELELPSGNVALVKRPGPGALLAENIMPDTLMPIVQQAIAKGQGMRPADTAKLMDDPAAIVGMLEAMDRLMCKVVVEPKPIYHKCFLPAMGVGGITQGTAYGEGEWRLIPDELRDGVSACDWCGEKHPHADEEIYTDEVEMEDKFFIFQYAVGGTRDLERFRSEHAASVGNLSNVAGDEDSA